MVKLTKYSDSNQRNNIAESIVMLRYRTLTPASTARAYLTYS